MKKLNERKCKACYGKRYYTVMFNLVGHEDFGDDGFEVGPKIYNVACPKCNYRNKRKIKNVRRSVFG